MGCFSLRPLFGAKIELETCLLNGIILSWNLLIIRKLPVLSINVTKTSFKYCRRYYESNLIRMTWSLASWSYSLLESSNAASPLQTVWGLDSALSIKTENRHWSMNDSWCGQRLLLLWAALWAGHWKCGRLISEWCRGRAKRKEPMMKRSLRLFSRDMKSCKEWRREWGSARVTGESAWEWSGGKQVEGENAEEGERGRRSDRWSTEKRRVHLFTRIL